MHLIEGGCFYLYQYNVHPNDCKSDILDQPIFWGPVTYILGALKIVVAITFFQIVSLQMSR